MYSESSLRPPGEGTAARLTWKLMSNFSSSTHTGMSTFMGRKATFWR